MSAERSKASRGVLEGYKSDFAERRKSANSLDISSICLGQMNPRHCPEHCPQCETPDSAERIARDPLGDALDIRAVAALFGCSVWTVRQRYIPSGLPHMRASRAGRIVFFRQQVIDWILQRQQRHKKGGTAP